MNELLEQAFGYHKWANLHLLDVCGALPEEQLELSSPGTYGTIASTWQHLLAAEQRYLARLMGEEPELSERKPFPGIGPLRREAERTGDELIAAASALARGESGDYTFGDQRLRLSRWVFAVQALHHGNDHRTHICTILGTHGIEYGDMDVWAFSRATGHETTLGKAD
ncbi:MAG TPA: DinB family protein [Candidatus Acidoferrum sp.]|nr:DinB family protein [Candidatus Acidoferrum sp.]